MNTSTFTNWSLETDEQNTAWLRLATQDSGPNILGRKVLEELDHLLEQLRTDRPAGLIITSGKTNGFIAGADIKEFTQIKNQHEALELISDGQSVFDKLEALPFPTLALINGYCLGGGTELALACDYRIALDDPKTRIALPEVKLGIHPGFGGTMRSIRLMGPLAAMNMMLTGSGMDTRRAKRTGLIDDRVPERQMESAARQVILKQPGRRRMNWQGRLISLPGIRSLIAQQMRKTVRKKAQQDHYPAPYALIDLWEKFAGNEQNMLKQEARSVSELILTETALNLIRVFNLQTGLKALGNRKFFRPVHVHVIGAGAMGGDIAAWCALMGMQVSVQDLNRTALAATMQRAGKLFKRRFRSHPQLATAAMDRLIPDEAGIGIAQADVVIEAIVEKLDVKRTVFRDVEQKAKPDALLATNTSSIPIEQIAEDLDDPGRLIGLHFFNPVARMPLLEIVLGPQTHDSVKEQAMAFSRHIDKLPAAVKSSPGFLVNRILMPYLLEGVLMEQEGIPASIIDQAAKQFGMPMGPLELGDSVGLDVCLYVGKILAGDDATAVPHRLEKLVNAGNLGKKSGQGYYRWVKGKPVSGNNNIGEFDIQEIQDRLMLKYLNESVSCLREQVIADGDQLDAAMIFGTGFAPFRGGPLHYINVTGAADLRSTMVKLSEKYGDRFKPDEGWDLIEN